MTPRLCCTPMASISGLHFSLYPFTMKPDGFLTFSCEKDGIVASYICLGKGGVKNGKADQLLYGL